jgi:hypothetical protein
MIHGHKWQQKRQQILQENPSISPEELQARLNPDMNKMAADNAAKPMSGNGMGDLGNFQAAPKDPGAVQDVGNSVVSGIQAVANGSFQPKAEIKEIAANSPEDQQYQQDIKDARFANLRQAVK